ncbi:MAG: WecB/TagA/CpsF family glycosyltransferase [Rubrimonas sp.]
MTLLLERDAESGFVDVVTPNVDHVVRINRNPQTYAALYEKAWLCVNDSRVLSLLARLRGLSLSTVPGADLAVALLEDARLPRDARICMVGGDDSLAADLRARFGLADLTRIDAPMGLARKPAAIAEIAESVAAGRYRLVFLCVGSPQQEMIAAAVKARGGATGVGLCVGAALEFAVGRKPRAPRIMQRLALEWLFRLASEPTRLYRRYLIDGPRILGLFMRDAARPPLRFVATLDGPGADAPPQRAALGMAPHG